MSQFKYGENRNIMHRYDSLIGSITNTAIEISSEMMVPSKNVVATMFMFHVPVHYKNYHVP